MRVVGISILALLALFTGGCSIVFLFIGVADNSTNGALGYVLIPCLVGLVICGLCVMWIKRLLNRTPTPPKSGEKG